MSRINCCPNCGGTLLGDGYTTVFHCENASEESYRYSEPDAETVYCEAQED